MNSKSYVGIFYFDQVEIIQPLQWLQKNHILHFTQRLDSSEETVDSIKEIAKKTAVDLQEFFCEPIGDDNWMKENTKAIKTPIFVKLNNVNIYSPDGTSTHEFLHIGFDTNILSVKLNLNK